jgi:flagellar basal-body rod modification protein FlgD
VVSSVDLTQQPPLLSIDGQTFTVDQIQRIVG